MVLIGAITWLRICRVCVQCFVSRVSRFVFRVSSAFAALQAVRSVDHKIFLDFCHVRVSKNQFRFSREHSSPAKNRGSAV